jgi:hypothetical protein
VESVYCRQHPQLKTLCSSANWALEGIHVVNFNGKASPTSTIKIKVGLVAPEGSGSYVYCRHQNLIDHAKHAIALDFGTGTLIVTVFAPGGSVEYREVLSVGGCIDLLDAIRS